jgi:putative ABC transport system permease protein
VSWFVRFSNLFRRDKLTSDLDEELQFHLNARTRDNIRAGMAQDAANRDARRRFGSQTLARERTHETEIALPIETIFRDLRYAVRGLCKSPGFALVAILTLALGFGVNIAVFTVVNGILLRPLPFPQPDRLFLISWQAKNAVLQSSPGLSDSDYLDFAKQTRLFEHVATFAEDSATLTGMGEPIRLPAALVTPSFFSALEVNPARGRAFAAGEERPGSGRVVILSDGLWRSRFSADPNILGRSITLDGTAYTVVGVMPAGFAFPHEDEFWLPLSVGTDPNNSYFRPVLGRLRPSVTRQQALAELEALARQRPPAPGRNRGDMVAEILPLKDLLVGNIRRSLLVFMGAVAFVLLIACANVANLLLMRGTSRQREIAVRNALGARRGRLIRQLLTESTLVSLAGSVAGILLAILGVPLLLALVPAAAIPRIDEIHIDGSVLAFSIVMGLAMGVAFGLVPALQITRRPLRDGLSRSGPTLTERRERLRSTLVVGEVALALVLLTGAGLMLKSFVRMRAVDPGFRMDNVRTMTVDLPDATYPNVKVIQAFQQQVLERVSNLPGVLASGAVNWIPLRPDLVMGDFHLEGGRKLPPGYIVDKPAVSPDYFRAMGIELLRGRAFTGQDKGSASGVAIVSQSVARSLWPGDDAIGKRITMEDDPKPSDWLTIVGVVEDIRQQSLTEPAHPAIYQPLEQVTRPFFLSHMSFVVRTAAKTEGIAAALRGAVHQVDRNQPVSISAMTDLMDATTAETWFQTRLISAFSVLALLLSAIGIYGVLAYAVTERTREIGIRMALGANKNNIALMLLRRTLLLIVAGVVIGGCGALALTRVLARFLFLVKPTDPATFLSVAAVLTVTGIIAGLLPARRATRVDPIVALRCE